MKGEEEEDNVLIPNYNEDEDGWMLTEDSILGCCILRLPLIGWPSVALSEIINR